jgi:hypothetical protein
MAALLLALTEIYARKYELLPRLQEPAVPLVVPEPPVNSGVGRLVRWLPRRGG